MPAVASRIDPDLVARLTAALTQVHGVTGAVVCDAEGEVAGGTTNGVASHEAGLAAFVCGRARGLSGDGGLRGMGRQLIGSELHGVSLSGSSGDFLVMPYGDGSVFITTSRGASPQTIAAEVSTTLQRYA